MCLIKIRIQQQKIAGIRDGKKRQKTEIEVSDLNEAIDHWRKIFDKCKNADERQRERVNRCQCNIDNLYFSFNNLT